jgi:tyrosine-protein kinase Etk/Wzc
LQIEARTGSLALPEGMQELLGNASGNAAGEAEIQIMRSRMVLGPVVEELGLQVFARPRQLPVIGMVPARLDLPDTGIGLLRPFQWGNERIRLGELEVPEPLLGKSLTLRITGPGAYVLVLPDQSEHAGKVRERLALPDRGPVAGGGRTGRPERARVPDRPDLAARCRQGACSCAFPRPSSRSGR